MSDAPPSAREEKLLGALFRRTFMRGLEHAPQDPAPPEWHARPFGIVRATGGVLAALHFPVEHPRGVVVFGHPGIPPAKGYFHRSDRIPFVRALGFAAMSFDHGGFGESDDPTGLYHREWADVLAWARRRHPGIPIHVWGVSLGGYFAHHALANDPVGVRSAIFEEVSPDLLRYGDAMPGRLGSALTGLAMPRARRWIMAETHAPHMAAEHVLYVSAADDKGVPPTHASRLVGAAGPFAEHHVVDGAAHLESWKKGGDALRKAVEAHLAR